ncbi:hypothetical protein B0H19DRAFT_1273653 [Mycena capillaripes]|nr:hypothetical protein B0H19DRAFT_1273653 [Mycena capillaripes]
MLPAHEGQHAIRWFIHDPLAMFMKGSEFNIPHSWINSTLAGLERVNPFIAELEKLNIYDDKDDIALHALHIEHADILAHNSHRRAATRESIVSSGLPLYPPLPPPTRHARLPNADLADDATSPLSFSTPGSPLTSPGDPESPAILDPPPHLPSSRTMSKLEFPKLTESLTPPAIHGWLSHCEDTYEAWQAMNPDRSIAPGTLITLAGLKMEESTAATWWNENRTDLKALKSWELFAQKVKDRYVPSNWCMTALAAFYAIQQGSSTFPKFANSLQNARNSLTGAGVGYTISDSILQLFAVQQARSRFFFFGKFSREQLP